MPTVYGFTDWFTLLPPKISVFLEYLNTIIIKQYCLTIISSPIMQISIAHSMYSVLFILFSARNRYLCCFFVFDKLALYGVIIPDRNS